MMDDYIEDKTAMQRVWDGIKLLMRIAIVFCVVVGGYLAYESSQVEGSYLYVKFQNWFQVPAESHEKSEVEKGMEKPLSERAANHEVTQEKMREAAEKLRETLEGVKQKGKELTEAIKE